MITPDDALARLLALARPVAVETLALRDAGGRWAAAAVAARRTHPPADLSAMDGYALRYADMPGPWCVIGTSAAGAPLDCPIGAGQAARIYTGAALPLGADTIVVQEDVDRAGDTVAVTGRGPDHAGAHVRRAGTDFGAGRILIATGERFTPARIGLAAMGGHGTVATRRRIRVGLVSTGDELTAVGDDCGIAGIPASNAVMIGALLADLPVDLTDLGIVRDDRAAIAACFARAKEFDVMVSTGGASVGDHDLVQIALTDAGATIDFWRIAMRPGKPMMAGTLGTTVVLGLPGNPVSAFVTATLFLKPLVRHLSGARDCAAPTLTARIACPMPVVGERTDYVRARWVDGAVTPIDGDSGMLAPLAAASALIIRPAKAPAIAAGHSVQIIPLA